MPTRKMETAVRVGVSPNHFRKRGNLSVLNASPLRKIYNQGGFVTSARYDETSPSSCCLNARTAPSTHAIVRRRYEVFHAVEDGEMFMVHIIKVWCLVPNGVLKTK